MRVFVTGAQGFVGRRLVPRLREAGHEPVGWEREDDVTDGAGLAARIAELAPDALVHLAARSSVAESGREPEAGFRVNFLGALHLLRAQERHCPEARVLLVGSGDQYGPAPPVAPPFRESTPLAPRSPYARTKAAAEGLGAWAARAGRPVVRVRAFNHTGAGQDERFVASSFARQVAELSLGMRPPRLRVGNLDSCRDFLDVEDVVDAYLALLEPGLPVGVYNVASGEARRVRWILDTLLERAGVEAEIQVDPTRFRPTDLSCGDPTRLSEACGWRPRRPLEATLDGLLADWRRRLSEDRARPAPAP